MSRRNPSPKTGALEIPPGRYYTKAQVAALYNVTPAAVDRWIRFAYLPALRAGSLGWLIEEQTLAAFTRPTKGPRPYNSPVPDLPEAERRKYQRRRQAAQAAYKEYEARRDAERARTEPSE